MGYALFAQRKLVLTSCINSINLQQTQRSNEQYMLSTHTLSLQSQLSSLQAAQAEDLADLYALLAASSEEDGITMPEDDEQEEILQGVLDNYFDGNTDVSRDSINAKIKELQERDKAELDTINRQIYQVGVKEQAIELEIKRLDTQFSAYEKQLEAVEEAEGKGIDRSTPKFSGIG